VDDYIGRPEDDMPLAGESVEHVLARRDIIRRVRTELAYTCRGVTPSTSQRIQRELEVTEESLAGLDGLPRADVERELASLIKRRDSVGVTSADVQRIRTLRLRLSAMTLADGDGGGA